MEIHLVEGIRRAVPDGQGDPQSENALVEALEGLFEKALSEAAAEAAGGEVENAPAENAECAEEIANSVDANGTEHGEAGSGKGGQFVSKGGGGAREPETKPQHDRYGLNDESRLAMDPEKNAERAKTALDEVIRKHSGFVDKAAYRPECGWIRLDWGDAGDPSNNYKGGHGLAHIAAKHPEAVKELPGILAKGTVYKHEQPGKLYVLHGEKYAILGSLHGGAKKTITEFISSHDKDKLDFIKKQPRAKAPGGNKGR